MSGNTSSPSSGRVGTELRWYRTRWWADEPGLRLRLSAGEAGWLALPWFLQIDAGLAHLRRDPGAEAAGMSAQMTMFCRSTRTRWLPPGTGGSPMSFAVLVGRP